MTKAQGIKPPAIIIIGEVVEKKESYINGLRISHYLVKRWLLPVRLVRDISLALNRKTWRKGNIFTYDRPYR